MTEETKRGWVSAKDTGYRHGEWVQQGEHKWRAAINMPSDDVCTDVQRWTGCPGCSRPDPHAATECKRWSGTLGDNLSAKEVAAMVGGVATSGDAVTIPPVRRGSSNRAFKVGDRVRVIKSKFTPNQLGIVDGWADSDDGLEIRVALDSSAHLGFVYFRPSELEIADSSAQEPRGGVSGDALAPSAVPPSAGAANRELDVRCETPADADRLFGVGSELAGAVKAGIARAERLGATATARVDPGITSQAALARAIFAAEMRQEAIERSDVLEVSPPRRAPLQYEGQGVSMSCATLDPNHPRIAKTLSVMWDDRAYSAQRLTAETQAAAVWASRAVMSK